MPPEAGEGGREKMNGRFAGHPINQKEEEETERRGKSGLPLPPRPFQKHERSEGSPRSPFLRRPSCVRRCAAYVFFSPSPPLSRGG